MEKTFTVQREVIGYTGTQVKSDVNVGVDAVEILREPNQKETGSLSVFCTHNQVKGKLWVDASGLKIVPGEPHDMKFNASIVNGVLTEE